MRTAKRRAGPVTLSRRRIVLLLADGSVAAGWFRPEYLTRASTFRVTDFGVADGYKWVQ